MESSTTKPLRIGGWLVNPASSEIVRGGETVRLDVRTMRLLLCLAERAGQVVRIDDLLNQVWPEVNVSPDSAYQAIASLRRQLGDDSRQPTYIETVPRLGYRMVAKVQTLSDTSTDTLPTAVVTPRAVNRRWVPVLTVCLSLAVIVVVLVRRAIRTTVQSTSTVIAAPSQKSIAVLPFLDLTEGMKEEEFADGMTEELIDKLSKIAGLRVPSPTSSFYFKGKQIPVSEIAKTLGVMYVLDGSVRKSGGRVRIAARLIQVDSGFVIWSETYERPFNDVIMVQDDIAGEVTKKLSASIESPASQPR